ncbi:MAG: PhoH family protein [Candidatus Omnitrophica bacterium]|nr:PhoH family protein [Candidatus Omnitrophota bacterium]
MEKAFTLHSDDEAKIIFGNHDEHLKAIEAEYSVKIVARGEHLTVNGEDSKVRDASKVFSQLLRLIRSGRGVRRQEVQYFVKAVAEDPSLDLEAIYKDRIEVPSKKQFVTPKTKGQKEYVDAIRGYDIVIGIGPAGIGKTYLAMAMAVSALRKGEVSRIILTRPAVEAGESLGFLPGDLHAKVSPYLRPLYDALYEMIDADNIHKFMESGVIEVAPLAYMRGRTLNDSFIIMDEAQNATPEQLKMFLTRLGFDSKTVITGDVTQSDLPGERAKGLIQVTKLLKHIEEIKVVSLTGRDVVRHELVQKIIKAYEELDRKK